MHHRREVFLRFLENSLPAMVIAQGAHLHRRCLGTSQYSQLSDGGMDSSPCGDSTAGCPFP